MEKSRKDKILKLKKCMYKAKADLLFGMTEECGLGQTLDYFLGGNWAIRWNEDGGFTVIPIEPEDESAQTHKRKKYDNSQIPSEKV